MTPLTLACDWTMDDDAAVQKAFRTTARTVLPELFAKVLIGPMPFRGRFSR
ncbi:hypothetical protein [Rhodovulum sp. YEN HP10]|uniref:hypothetical protein n=1 Tax=Rhodovulum sp. HP10 TaxID=3387397 RepID=UPI0039DF3679